MDQRRITLEMRPIGFVRSPFKEKAEAPRQAVLAAATEGRIELLPELRDALADLDGFDRIWVLFWFDQAEGWKPKVLPPRSEEKRGVFATRSPHRPNPIGLSAVRLVRVDAEACVLHIADLDLIEGTPVFDIKPYIAYADAFPDASQGWLAPSPPDAAAAWSVTFEPAAEDAAAWVKAESDLDLRERVEATLKLGPQPHAYRRIKEVDETHSVLAIKEWRATFHHNAVTRTIVVEQIATGYRDRDLETGTDPLHALHRRFIER